MKGRTPVRAFPFVALPLGSRGFSLSSSFPVGEWCPAQNEVTEI